MVQATQWDIVVIGGAGTEYLARGPQLPVPGGEVQGDLFLEAPGGRGANQAVAAARLGARVTLVACIGADKRGTALSKHLSTEGVDTSQIVLNGQAPTGITLVMVDATGQHQMLTVPGANKYLRVADVLAAREALMSTRVLLSQLTAPLECVTEAIEWARTAGAQVVLNPTPPTPLPEDLLGQVDLINTNDREAEVLTGIRVKDQASARTAARRLLERGVGAVAVQAGSSGTLLAWNDAGYWEEQLLPLLPVDRVDVTGAGDAFAAGLAVALAEGRSLTEAGPFASAAAALTMTALGAQLAFPNRSVVQTLLTGIRDR